MPKRFGIEFEMNFKEYGGYSYDYDSDDEQEIVRTMLIKMKQPVAGYSGAEAWCVKEDGSCGMEITTPALTWRDWPTVVKVCKALRNKDYNQFDDCGLHVHFETGFTNVQQLRNLTVLWAVFEPQITKLISRARLANTEYCPLYSNSYHDSYDYDSDNKFTPVALLNYDNINFRRNVGRDRYALNVSQWWQNGRIEVRLHQGTLNTNHIKWWIQFGEALIKAAKTMKQKDINNLPIKATRNKFAEVLGFGWSSKLYRREQQFAA